MIEKIINQIISQFPIIRGIYYHGSRVRGDHRDESDYDLLIILKIKPTYPIKEEIWGYIYDFMLEYDIIIDAHILSQMDDELNVMPLVVNAKKDGIYYE